MHGRESQSSVLRRDCTCYRQLSTCTMLKPRNDKHCQTTLEEQSQAKAIASCTDANLDTSRRALAMASKVESVKTLVVQKLFLCIWTTRKEGSYSCRPERDCETKHLSLEDPSLCIYLSPTYLMPTYLLRSCCVKLLGVNEKAVLQARSQTQFGIAKRQKPRASQCIARLHTSCTSQPINQPINHSIQFKHH